MEPNQDFQPTKAATESGAGNTTAKEFNFQDQKTGAEPAKTKKVWPVILAIVIVLCIIAGICVSCSRSKKAAADDAAQAAETAPVVTEQPAEAAATEAEPEATAEPVEAAEPAATAEPAAEPEETEQAESFSFSASSTEDELLPLKNAEVGDIVTYGTYEQDNDEANGAEAIEWIVLAKEDDRVLLLSRYALDSMYYHEYQVPVYWRDCSLRRWLNNDFYNTAFTAEEQGYIQTTEVSNATTGSTEDNLFLLNIAEATSYLPQGADRQCVATPYAVSHGAFVNSVNGYSLWWLRNTGSESLSKAAYVITRDGSCEPRGDYVKLGGYCVRPAMWVSLAG